MSRRIFLDVGANTGQSLAAALDPVFSFDWLVSFEPVEFCWKYLERVAGRGSRGGESEHSTPDTRHFPEVRIERFGLWNKTCFKLIFEPGIKGASMWHKDKARSDASELCQFRRATDWFKENIKTGDTVYLKLNCEGAECDILDDLLDSREFDKVTFAMVDFDVRKIASQKHREAELRERLAAFTFPRWASSKDVMVGATHEARIKNWLRMTENPIAIAGMRAFQRMGLRLDEHE